MYRAPEVRDGIERDSRSDIYSLGCVFLQMLFALEGQEHRIFEVMDEQTLYYGSAKTFANNMPTLWLELQSFYPDGDPRAFLVNIIMKMTAHNPMDRWVAAKVSSEISAQQGFCCATCLATPWTWSAQHDKWYRVFHDSNGMILNAVCIQEWVTNCGVGQVQYMWS
jgi:serine/threonine protein kinase